MTKANKWMIDPQDAVMLLIDYQSGLFQLVRDIELPVLRSHVTALAKISHMDFASVMVEHIVPPYRALMESYDKAQSVQKVGKETHLDRLEAARK